MRLRDDCVAVAPKKHFSYPSDYRLQAESIAGIAVALQGPPPKATAEAEASAQVWPQIKNAFAMYVMVVTLLINAIFLWLQALF